MSHGNPNTEYRPRKVRGRWTIFPVTRVVIKKWVRMGARVVVTCPRCGFRSTLDHHVDAHGKVHPSVVCPMCDFHEWVTLGGWDVAPKV